MTPGSGTRTLTGTSGVNAFVIDPQQHLLLATRLTQADFHWDNQPASSKVLLGTVLQPDHTGLKYFAVQGDPQAQLTIGGQPYTPGHPVSVQQGQPLWLSVQLSQAQSTGQLQLLWGERPEALTPIPEGLLLASPQSPEQQFTTQTIGLNQNIIVAILSGTPSGGMAMLRTVSVLVSTASMLSRSNQPTICTGTASTVKTWYVAADIT